MSNFAIFGLDPPALAALGAVAAVLFGPKLLKAAWSRGRRMLRLPKRWGPDGEEPGAGSRVPTVPRPPDLRPGRTA